MTDQDQTTDQGTDAEAQQRPFSQWMLEQRSGGLHAELTEKLAEVVAGVMDLQKPGSLTLTVKVNPMENGINVIVADKVDAKVPQPSSPPSLFFADSRGNLSRSNPHQTELPLRELPRTRNQEAS